MKLRTGVFAAALLAVGAAGVAYAQEQTDVINLRQQLMKTNAAAAALAVKMIRGDVPYDADVAKAAVESIGHDNTVFPHLFPAGSEGGKAGPAIWSDKAGFDAASKAMVDATTAAAAAAAGGKDAFGAAFGAVGQACQSCHEKYRAG
jgi:cytochrome c556